MFKKLKDKLEEEFKQGPLKLPVSVQQLAQVISPSPSLNSLSDNNPSSSVTYTSDPSNVSTDFFSIGDDDDSQDGTSSKTMPLHSIDLTATSPSNITQSRSRRSSMSSITSEASSLFPIYENPSGSNHFQSDLESEMEDGMPSQIEKISKEHLYQSYKKIFNRYNKYKGRYVDLHRHYKELLHDNIKTKNVLQESQDKALRRIAELKEQCQLEQNAKAHLEESLRNDVEDRDHMITTLKTKISLLRGGGGSNDGLLLDINDKDVNDISTNNNKSDELEKLKLENERLQKEIGDLKKLKETACHLIHRCDTTIDEATEDVDNENLKRKMSELKSEIQKMKSENESLSHLLSRNIITEEEKKSQNNREGNLLIDLSGTESSQGDQRTDEKDKKIEKLNNLLLKCKEKISSLTAEVKSKNLIIEDKNKKFKEMSDEMDMNKKSIAKLTAEMEALKMREEENVLSVAENKMAIHKELETKEEQIRALTKELKTSENEFRKEKDEIIRKYEDKLKEMTDDFTRELKYKNEENEKLSEDLLSKNDHASVRVKEWETEFKKMFDIVMKSYESFIESKSAEIERAGFRLEERLSVVQKKLIGLIQVNQKELENRHNKLKETIEEKDRTINEMRGQESSFEKLNIENQTLLRRIEELEISLTESRKTNEEVVSEKGRILEEREVLKSEIEHWKGLSQMITSLELKNEKVCLNPAGNNKLNEELSAKKPKSCEKDKSAIQTNKSETEAEKKLREYIENYKKLEKENQALENNLNQKCDRLVKDLNDSKEKIKVLEGENKAKISEMEGLKSELGKLTEELKESNLKFQEFEKERGEISAARDEMKQKYENASDELSSLKEKHSIMIGEKSVIEEENELLKKELLSADGRANDANNQSIQIVKELNARLNELETVKRDLSTHVTQLEENLKSEIKANECLRKELKERSIVEEEVRVLNKKNEELEAQVRKLECEYEIEQKKSSERDCLIQENDNLKRELSAVSAKVHQLERSGENEKLKLELAESEKLRSEVAENLKKAIKEKNDVSDSLQMKLNELETLKQSLNSTKEELSEKVKSLEEEKLKLTSENENKLNVLKNEIKFMNNKFEEDLGNMEESRNAEMTELNSKLEVAEKTSSELVEKLERITSERDEAKIALEEKDMKITEMEGCLATLKVELDSKFIQGTSIEKSEKHEQDVRNKVTSYESELMKKEEELETLKKKLQDYNQVIQKLRSSNERLKDSEDQHISGENPESIYNEEKNGKDVEETVEKEKRLLTNAGKEKEEVPTLEGDTLESIQKKLYQQAAEMRELKKQHKREVTELRKIISVKRKSRRNSAESPDWGGTLDNDTEHEYLRNILYEYMMGREQLVLAKVLSAIVKFDKQQTRNVLEKEQHRQTLFGQLGIL